MDWINFPYYFTVTISLWLIGIIALLYSYKKESFSKIALVFLGIGSLALIAFVINLWIQLDRPPMRTLGETRLWYSTFIPVIGFITYFRWKYKWFLIYSFCMAGLFLVINYLNPETHSKTLMPALQSVWFIPHVLVYLFSYAVLSASCIIAIKGTYEIYKGSFNPSHVKLADNLVYIGFSFLTLGLLFGALWAKEAWGHYWTWDPKEVWAFLTWMGYLIYIHYRFFHPNKSKQALYILSVAFIILLVCWFGVNYLPVASNSVHTYTQ
ncbi:cytochrome c biogenesis protein CcsA [Winogradskyella sp.]|jgi:ABC-type transport system involved in cytochrome c biogenesis permease subunit|uniref:cytochrome c biogenesis protein CcsA n=1 Tax=Winogradskyella sp. TaxID=1883156 RepID=UPI0025FFB3CE|nr:cytochrome c biogenesis protein CcsA [Winogradskyella sp.]MCT4628698.1 cytochrome c biogenesis protein CcsA [Winogradskyella sp.]